MKKNDNIIARTIHGAFFLIDISDNYAGDKCALYELNETGKYLWDHITKESTIESLAHQLFDAILDKVDYQIIYADTAEFLRLLQHKGFLSEV